MSLSLAVFLVVACGLGAGALGGALTYWALLRLLRMLEYRLSDVEERVVREVKIRAAEKSLQNRKQETGLEEWAKNEVDKTQAKPVSTFTDWYKSRMTK